MRKYYNFKVSGHAILDHLGGVEGLFTVSSVIFDILNGIKNML
jgi:hypothetical protein